jgi:hypothetical protein
MPGTTCGRACCTQTMPIFRKASSGAKSSTDFTGVYARGPDGNHQVLVTPKGHPQTSLVHSKMTAEEGGVWYARWKTNAESLNPLSLSEFQQEHGLKISNRSPNVNPPNLNGAAGLLMGPPQQPVLPLARGGAEVVVRTEVHIVPPDAASVIANNVSLDDATEVLTVRADAAADDDASVTAVAATVGGEGGKRPAHGPTGASKRPKPSGSSGPSGSVEALSLACDTGFGKIAPGELRAGDRVQELGPAGQHMSATVERVVGDGKAVLR